MKLLGYTSLLIVGSVTVLAIGCGKKKDDGGVPVTQYQGKVGASCSANGGSDTLTTDPQQTCDLLTKDIQAGCDVEARKVLFEKMNCNPGSAASDVLEDNGSQSAAANLNSNASQAAASNLSTSASGSVATTVIAADASGVAANKNTEDPAIFHSQVLTDNKDISLEIKATADKSDNAQDTISAKVTIACADNLKKADEMTQSIVLVGDGKIAAVHGDLSQTKTPAISISCVSAEKTKEDLSKESMTKLKVGQKISDKKLDLNISGTKEDSLISCNNNSTNAVLSGNNGLQMLEGTVLLLKNSDKSVLVSCEK